MPNPTPKAWQPGPSFVSSPSVRRKHRVRRVAHAADRRAIHSPARTSQQVESSNAQKMAHSPHPPPARRVLHVHATTSPIKAGCIPDVAVSLLPHPPHVAQTRMPDRTRMPADSPACRAPAKRQQSWTPSTAACLWARSNTQARRLTLAPATSKPAIAALKTGIECPYARWSVTPVMSSSCPIMMLHRPKPLPRQHGLATIAVGRPSRILLAREPPKRPIASRG